MEANKKLGLALILTAVIVSVLGILFSVTCCITAPGSCAEPGNLIEHQISIAKEYSGIPAVSVDAGACFRKNQVFLTKNFESRFGSPVYFECSPEIADACQITQDGLEILRDFRAKISACCEVSYTPENKCTVKIGEEHAKC